MATKASTYGIMPTGQVTVRNCSFCGPNSMQLTDEFILYRLIMLATQGMRSLAWVYLSV